MAASKSRRYVAEAAGMFSRRRGGVHVEGRMTGGRTTRTTRAGTTTDGGARGHGGRTEKKICRRDWGSEEVERTARKRAWKGGEVPPRWSGMGSWPRWRGLVWGPRRLVGPRDRPQWGQHCCFLVAVVLRFGSAYATHVGA
jgi:hypothetical protein